MASSILSNVAEKAKNMTGEQNKKIAQLSADTKDVHDESWRITSDYGVKQNNTDHWLAAVSEDKQGPQLLEDPFGREKVRSPTCLCGNSSTPSWPVAHIHRSTASTTSAFPNA
jgi:hypothetical protein